MKVVSGKDLNALSEQYGFSIAHAEGYVEGEAFRSRGEAPSTYALVGIDDFAAGFRAGYFLRTRR